MKALSVNSYYATEILEGRKSVECRSWKTNYRGDLLICANSVKNDYCLCGRAACIVELKDIVPFTADHLKDAHMDQLPDDADSKQYYAWIIERVSYVIPIKISGQLNLFNVDDDLVSRLEAIAPDAEHAHLFDFTDTPENGYNHYFTRFFENIVEPAYYYYNRLYKQVHADTPEYHVDDDFCNNFFDVTGFEPSDIWDNIPIGFTRR